MHELFPLLYQLLKINGGYFANSPHILKSEDTVREDNLDVFIANKRVIKFISASYEYT
jgi:hypothetical protein